MNSYLKALYIMELNMKLASHDICLAEYLDKMPDDAIPNIEALRKAVNEKSGISMH